MLNKLRAVLFLGAVYLSVAVAALVVAPPPLCTAVAQRIGAHTVPLRQQLVRVTISPSCVRPGYAVVRYRTARGGILPPHGYLILRPGYPREDRYWLSPGGSVQVKRADGTWVTVWRSGG